MRLTDTVARAYFKTLAYKDEYEVARLHVETPFLDEVRREFGTNATIRFHLAPPLLPAENDARGRPRKKTFGPWMIPVFHLMAKLRGLRGTPLDVFGYTAERRMERALIDEFEQTVDSVLSVLTKDNVRIATDIVGHYLAIRGYGPVKDAAVEAARARISSGIAELINVDRHAA